MESDLRPLRQSGTTALVGLRASDAVVREAFVRVAYDGVATGRSRQRSTTDSPPLTASQRLPVALPGGAVSYRVRMLARLTDPGTRSAEDAITAALRMSRGSARPAGWVASRLLE